MSDVEIYATGLVCCSVCAPENMPKDEVERQVNAVSPTGISSAWEVSEDETFADGTKNGGVVECHRGKTRHWLLNC